MNLCGDSSSLQLSVSEEAILGVPLNGRDPSTLKVPELNYFMYVYVRTYM